MLNDANNALMSTWSEVLKVVFFQLFFLFLSVCVWCCYSVKKSTKKMHGPGRLRCTPFGICTWEYTLYVGETYSSVVPKSSGTKGLVPELTFSNQFCSYAFPNFGVNSPFFW
jgi:hypothetical protein